MSRNYIFWILNFLEPVIENGTPRQLTHSNPGKLKGYVRVALKVGDIPKVKVLQVGPLGRVLWALWDHRDSTTTTPRRFAPRWVRPCNVGTGSSPPPASTPRELVKQRTAFAFFSRASVRKVLAVLPLCNCRRLRIGTLDNVTAIPWLVFFVGYLRDRFLLQSVEFMLRRFYVLSTFKLWLFNDLPQTV